MGGGGGGGRFNRRCIPRTFCGYVSSRNDALDLGGGGDRQVGNRTRRLNVRVDG